MRRAFSEDGLAVPDDRVTAIHGTSPETGYDATKRLVPLLRTGGFPRPSSPRPMPSPSV